MGRRAGAAQASRHNGCVSDLGPGDEFAGCRIEAVAGRGGMGVVYRATQLGLGRPVALKLIAEERAADPAFRDRFERESRLTAAIDHPNVIPVYSAGEIDGQLYLATRFVDGTDLQDGDRVLVQARLPKSDPGDGPYAARKLVDKGAPSASEDSQPEQD